MSSSWARLSGVGGSLRSSDRQLDVERRAAIRPRLETDAAAVLLHDRVGDRQAEPGALADFLRREERVEDLRLQIVGDSGAVVVDLEHDGFPIGVVPRADDEDAAAVRRQHRLLGVDHQVQQHLLDLVAVGEHRGEGRRRARRSP